MLKRLFLIAILFPILGCQTPESSTLFTLVSSKKSGLTFSNDLTESMEDNMLFFSNFYTGGGVGILDVNNDGLSDIFMGGNQVSSRLYLNKGGLRFEDITESAGITTDRLSVGKLAQRGNWKAQLIYAYLERFAVVDFLTQKDWARWSYSAQGSPDGRLTNLKGFEFMLGYTLNSNMDLQLRAYSVDQIVALGSSKETGDRVRLDLNIRF